MSLKAQLLLLIAVPLLCLSGAAWDAVQTHQTTTLAAGGAASSIPSGKALNDFILFLQEPPAPAGKEAQLYLQAIKNRIDDLPRPQAALFHYPEEERHLAILAQGPAALGRLFDQARRTDGTSLSSRHLIQLTRELTILQQANAELSAFYGQTLQTAERRNNRHNLLLLVVALVWPVGLSLLLYRTLARPVSKVRDALLGLAKGTLSYRLEGIAPGGEIGQLTSAFNKMAESRQKVEEHAKEAEYRLIQLYDNLQLLVVRLDGNGAVSYCNDYLVQATGRRRSEVIGKNWFELFVPEPEMAREVFSRLLAAGDHAHDQEQDIITARGERRRISWHSVLERDSNGTITGTCSIGDDITEQRAAEKGAERDLAILQHLVDAYPESLLLLDCAGAIMAANRTAASRMARTVGQLIGCDLYRLLAPDLAQECRQRASEACTSGQPVRFSESQPPHQFEHQLIPVLNQTGTAEYLAMLSIDRTEQCTANQELQTAYEALQRSSDELHDRLQAEGRERSDLRTSLDAITMQKQADDRARGALLTTMRGVLNAPLHAILGLSQLTMQTGLTGKQHDYLQAISGSAHHLLDTVNDFVDLSLLEAGQVHLAQIPFLLGDVIDRVMGLATLSLGTRPVTLTPIIAEGVPDWFLGDPLHLEQILANLLSNAITFTERGQISLRISCETSHTDTNQYLVQFSVQDTGIGMDEQTIASLYRPFGQSDGPAARTGNGSGLGLSLCKRLVEMMGGTISVVSSPGKGSTFSFRIACRPAEGKQRTRRAPLPAADQRTQNLRGYRLLVVEGDRTNRRIIQELFETYGMTVETAQHGAEAVRIVQEQGDGLHAVLMDLQMPVMDGYEATRLIRQRFSAQQLPIIALTAYPFDEQRERCLAAGMNDYLPKPINLETAGELLCWHISACGQPWAGQRHTVWTGEESPSLPDSLPGIDMPGLLERLNNNRLLLIRLVSLFAAEHRGIAQEIGQRIAESDLAAAARLVHGLEGVAGNLFAHDLQQSAALLEDALKRGGAPEATQLFARFEHELTTVMGAADLLGPVAPSLTAAEQLPAPDGLTSQLRLLYQQIHAHNPQAPLAVAQLQTALTLPDDLALAARLSEALDRLDFPGAGELLERLAAQRSITLKDDFLLGGG